MRKLDNHKEEFELRYGLAEFWWKVKFGKNMPF